MQSTPTEKGAQAPKLTSLTILKNDMLDNVLRALDKTAIEALGVTMPESVIVTGWKDEDIPALSKAIDAHARKLAERINAGAMPHSQGLRVLMDE